MRDLPVEMQVNILETAAKLSKLLSKSDLVVNGEGVLGVLFAGIGYAQQLGLSREMFMSFIEGAWAESAKVVAATNKALEEREKSS